MTSGLENASFSLPEWQAVKMIFFAPCEVKIYSCFQVILMLVVYGNEFTTKTHTKLLLTHTKIKDKIEPYRMMLITIIHSYYNNKFSAYYIFYCPSKNVEGLSFSPCIHLKTFQQMLVNYKKIYII